MKTLTTILVLASLLIMSGCSCKAGSDFISNLACTDYDDNSNQSRTY